jgi:hypothetical protein
MFLNLLLSITVGFLFLNCSSHFAGNNSFQPKTQVCEALTNGITETSTDKNYGYTITNPVNVGGGPRNQRLYISMLTGPKGEDLEIINRSSARAPNNSIVDVYEIQLLNEATTRLLYINMYKCENPKAPFDLLIKQ